VARKVTPAAGERDLARHNIAVVVPAFRVEHQIGAVLGDIPPVVRHVVVVDDASPDSTAEQVRKGARKDKRVVLIAHERNQGVGGAMRTGFAAALAHDPDIVIKLDGDGQMPAGMIPDLVGPIVRGEADFAKGNRFRPTGSLAGMPLIRRIGNAGLSFLAKAATGYWNCFDPTNGFLAIRADLLRRIPLERVDRSYFFEISFLSQLYLLGAVIQDVPMPARYEDEPSSMAIWKVLLLFPPKLAALLVRRLILKYLVYDFSMGSVYLLGSVPLLLFGLLFGGYNWLRYAQLGVPAPTGTIMLATLPVILGFQLLLSAIGVDLQSVPKVPLERMAPARSPRR
jgi:glycosyltransferase involved in cell wall biosynthesis